MTNKEPSRHIEIHCESHQRELETYINENHIQQEDIFSIGLSKEGDYMLVYFVNED